MKKIKNPYLILGLFIVSFIFLSSLIYSLVGGKVPNISAIYKNGNIVATFPFNPMQVPPFGTDDAGNNLFFELLVGAKYTIGIAVVVSIFRLLFSTGIGLLIGQVKEKYTRYVVGVSSAFNYMPVAVICYLLLYKVLWGEGVPPVFTSSYLVRVTFEVFILIVVALPATSLLIGSDIWALLKNDYITSARLLGGNRGHILRKHIWLHMKSKMWVFLIEQIVQVLILLCHLGLLHLFFGGTEAIQLRGIPTYLSMSNEWSGLVGKSYEKLLLSPWMAIFPLVAFAVIILGFNLILEGLKNTELSIQSKEAKRNTVTSPPPLIIDDEDFNALRKAGGGSL